MTIWIPNLEQYPGPRYQALAHAIETAVIAGELAPGARLPPQRDLAWKLGVTVGTVSRGYMLAEQKGLLSGEVGRGTFVKPPSQRGLKHPEGIAPSYLGSTPPDPAMPPVPNLNTPGLIDMSRNQPLLPSYDSIMRRSLELLAARGDLDNLLGYSRMFGDPAHRIAAANWIGRVGLKVMPEQVIATAGAQQALAVAIMGLAQPGDTILVEQLTYGGIHENARLRTAKLHGVAIDDDGMIPEALEEAVRQTGARIVMLQPTLHNPTNAIMPLSRRQQVVEIARRHDLTIVEDEVYGFVVQDRPPPFAKLAPERTVYITSASKCMAPGLRVGWIAAPLALLEPFGEALHAMAVNNPRLNQEIVRQWIEDGTADRMLADLRIETAARHAIACELLDGLTHRSHPGSLHTYLELPAPWRPNEFTAAALMHGIKIASCTSFQLDRRPNPPAWVRVSLASVTREEMREGLCRLRGLAERGPEARAGIV